MKTLLTEGMIEQCIGYIDKYLDKLERKEIFSITGNAVFDSILNYKLNLACQKEIKPSLIIKLPPDLDIDPLDISSLLGNLLDNAISAVERCTGDKWIDINIKCEKGLLIIKTKNPYSGELRYVDGKIKSSKRASRNLGVGLKSVESIVDKYYGVMKIQTHLNVFQVDSLLVLK